MARRRRKKQTLSQQVVGPFTLFLPAPIRDLASGRLASLMIVVGVPVLIAVGVLNINWENGLPKFSINQEKAHQLEAQALERFQQMEAERAGAFNAPLTGFRDAYENRR